MIFFRTVLTCPFAKRVVIFLYRLILHLDKHQTGTLVNNFTPNQSFMNKYVVVDYFITSTYPNGTIIYFIFKFHMATLSKINQLLINCLRLWSKWYIRFLIEKLLKFQIFGNTVNIGIAGYKNYLKQIQKIDRYFL